MRWFWIDRFIEFESGRRAVAIKNVAMSEPQVDGYTDGFPTMPASLIVEGLAQTGGLLVGEQNEFRERVVLAKLGKARFHFQATPGDTLRYTAEVEVIKDDGAIVHGRSHVGDRLQADVELVFAYLDDRFPEELFTPADFLNMLRGFRLYDVGLDAAGNPLKIPQRLLDAEADEFA